MPNRAAKFSSDYLPTEQVHNSLLALSGVLLELLGEHKLVAMYGWATKLHADLRYKPMREDTRWLQYLIEDSLDQRIIIPGESDFVVQVPEKRLEVTFCHESDIHLNGSDDELLERFMAAEPFVKMRWHTREEDDVVGQPAPPKRSGCPTL